MEVWGRAKWQADIHPIVNRLFLLILLGIFHFQQNSMHSKWIVYCARLIAGPEVITAH